MTNLRHIGLYVDNIRNMCRFYKDVFRMKVICEETCQKDNLTEQILQLDKNSGGGVQYLLITKLVTEYGAEVKTGDMVELIKVIGISQVKSHKQDYSRKRQLFETGCIHISIGVDNIEETVEKVKSYGGETYTSVCVLSGNKCCFVCDPEGNYIELIQRQK